MITKIYTFLLNFDIPSQFGGHIHMVQKRWVHLQSVEGWLCDQLLEPKFLSHHPHQPVIVLMLVIYVGVTHNNGLLVWINKIFHKSLNVPAFLTPI